MIFYVIEFGLQMTYTPVKRFFNSYFVGIDKSNEIIKIYNDKKKHTFKPNAARTGWIHFRYTFDTKNANWIFDNLKCLCVNVLKAAENVLER